MSQTANKKKTAKQSGPPMHDGGMHRFYMLNALLDRDPRAETLADLILQLSGHIPLKGEREQIEKESKQQHEALGRRYHVQLRSMPDTRAVEEVNQEIVADFDSGGAWLNASDVELLHQIDDEFGALKAHVTEQLAAIENKGAHQRQNQWRNPRGREGQAPVEISDLSSEAVIDHIAKDVAAGVTSSEIVQWLREAVRVIVYEVYVQRAMALSREAKAQRVTN